MTTYLQTEPQGPFLTLIEGVDLREYAVSEGKTLEEEARPCRDLRGSP